MFSLEESVLRFPVTVQNLVVVGVLFTWGPKKAEQKKPREPIFYLQFLLYVKKFITKKL